MDTVTIKQDTEIDGLNDFTIIRHKGESQREFAFRVVESFLIHDKLASLLTDSSLGSKLKEQFRAFKDVERFERFVLVCDVLERRPSSCQLTSPLEAVFTMIEPRTARS